MAEVLDGEYEARVPLERLQLHPRNPNEGDVGHLQDLIESNGFYGAVMAQRSTGFLLYGNHRYLAAKGTGIPAIPVIWVDVDDDEALRILLGDNEAGQRARPRADLLADLLVELAERSARGLEGTGYTPAYLDALLDQLGTDHAPPGRTEPDDVGSKPSHPRCRNGEIWLLGRHRLAVGDARDPVVVERALGGPLADAVITDPPYGVDYEGKTADRLTIEGDERDDVALEQLLRSCLGNARTWCRPGASWYVCSPAGPNFAVFGEVLGDLKVWRQTLVWVKDRFVLGRQDYHYRHELIVEGEVPDDLEQPGAPRFDPEMILAGWKPGAGHRRPPDRRQDTVWEFARPARSSEHPTMKPVALIDRAIRNSTAPGEIVLDVFAGSGTTLIAAHRAGRVACLVEKDLGYADVICRRWQDHTGLLPRLEGGEPVDFTVPLAVVEDDA